MFTAMKPKETRGRPKKYDFTLKKGQSVTQPFSTGARTTALKFAKNKGWKYRTWRENENLIVMRIE